MISSAMLIKEVTESISANPDCERLKQTISGCVPRADLFEGERGNSVFSPDRNEVPPGYNPDKLSWGEILDKFGVENIPFKDGHPVFDEICQEEVKIDNFSTERNKNFSQADKILAEKWNQEEKDGKNDWKASDIKNYRKENRLTWHEKEDMQTLQLVPSEIHNNIPHKGGIAKAKEKAQHEGE